jgi:ubiquinone/menaquinone biosynthesis C-methylase UbiE
MKLLAYVVERISDHPVLFIFFRGLLEYNFKAVRLRIRRELKCGPGSRTLDIGCGPGAFSDLFAGGDYAGIDINAGYIAWAKKHRQGVFVTGDARAIPFPDGRFDQVLVFGLLHHLNDEDARAVLREACRLVGTGGRILLIEDIPAVSRLNLIGHLIHGIENGKFIRPVEQYRTLYSAFGRLESEEVMRSGICDYFKAVIVRP